MRGTVPIALFMGYMNKTSSCERIDGDHAMVNLAGIEILGNDFMAPQLLSCGNDQCIVELYSIFALDEGCLCQRIS